MKTKTFFYLFIILVIAVLLRLWCLDKPEGLWNDEYVSWYIASRNSFSEFIDLVSKNCHTPLYYLFIKFWLTFFPDTDISLRLSSVITSLLTVVVMFFVGKEYKNSNTGLVCALFSALSSFYIYFAQEVRLYSLMSLVSSLLLFVTIKLLRNGQIRYFALFVVLNAVLCALHTLGLIFSFFLILYSSIYLYKNFDEWKNIVKSLKKSLFYVFPFVCVLLIISPFLFSILFSKSLSQFWGGFSFSKIAFSFIDYFSPLQINITNSADTFRMYLFKSGSLNSVFVFFALCPSLIAFIMLLKGFIKKDKILKLLLYVCISFFTVLIILSALGKMIILTKYSSEIYPILILTFTIGAFSFKHKLIPQIIVCTYFVLSLSYLYFSPVSAPKLPRNEGNKAPVALIEHSRLEKNDIIILTYYDIDKFERYFKTKNDYKIFSINKFNFNLPVFNDRSYHETIRTGKARYREVFQSFPNRNIISWINNITKNMKKGQKVGIVYLQGVSFFTNEQIKQIANDDIKYQKTPFIFLTFSMLRNNLMYSFKDEFIIDSITQAGDWTLIVYEKK